MRTFALGIGECGRRVGLEMFRKTSNNALAGVNKAHYFTLLDLADIEGQMKDVQKTGISRSDVNVFQPTDTELPAGSNLVIGRIKVTFGERGVGGLWFHSKEIAEEAWDWFQNIFKYHLPDNDWYSVFHSGGGGTGCGMGPVFLENIYTQFRVATDVPSEGLYTASLVLPNEYWEGWREANSATAIGRHSRIAHGIIVADNLQGDGLVEKALARNAPIETEDPRELINRRLAEVWISLHMANMPENNPEPKVYEAADYKRFFLNDNCAGILVPCFCEYFVSDFVRGGINLKGAVFDTIKNHQLMKFDLRSFENMIVIVTLPSGPSGLAGQVVKNIEDYGEIADMLQRMYGGNFAPPVIYTYSKSLVDTIKITALVKDPYIPRFSDLYQKLELIVENPTEMTKTINKMFPKDFDRSKKIRIMQSAKDEFRRACDNFSQYMCEQGMLVEERT